MSVPSDETMNRASGDPAPGLFAMGAAQRLTLALALSSLIALAAWWALSG